MSRVSIHCSESVTCGHPDKLCDQISDAIVDAVLLQDPLARIGAECAVASGILFVAARFAAQASVDIPELARDVIREVQYDEAAFHARSCSIMTSLEERDGALRTVSDERDLSDSALENIAGIG